MNNYIKIILVGFVGLGIIVLFGVWCKKYVVKNTKWDNCINLVNKFVPDPNETEQRVEFIKNCFEQNGKK